MWLPKHRDGRTGGAGKSRARSPARLHRNPVGDLNVMTARKSRCTRVDAKRLLVLRQWRTAGVTQLKRRALRARAFATSSSRLLGGDLVSRDVTSS